MKKWIKYSLTAAMALAAALLLCSCKALDAEKANHAVYADETHEKIEFRGKTYVLINETKNGGAFHGNYELITDYGTDAWVTEPDVPVLLKHIYGENIRFNGGQDTAPMFFAMDGFDITAGNITKYYCTADTADSFLQMLEEAKMDHFYFYHSVWDPETDDYTMEKNVFDDTSSKVIMDTIERPFDPATDHKSFNEISNVSQKYLIPFYCDKQGLFTDNRYIQIVRTKDEQRAYYIGTMKSGSDFGLDDRGVLVDVEWHKVAEKDVQTIEGLFKTYENEIGNFYFPEEEED